MANTTSWGFPNLIDPVRCQVNVLEDNASVVSRVRLLMLTDPTELYNNLPFGVGLRKYIWQYNNENVKAIIQSRIIEQLEEYEPCVDADKTEFADELLYTGEDNSNQKYNKLEMTVGLSTIFGENISVTINDKGVE